MRKSTTNAAVIRPGVLVALKSAVSGGVTYRRVDLDTGLTLDELRAKAEKEGTKVPSVVRWETTRTIDDPEEYAAACAARGRANALIRRHCCTTSFGLLCPEDSVEALDRAVAEAKALVAAHNEKASGTDVRVYVLKGRVAGTDEEAARAIVSEVAGLIDRMNSAISRFDVDEIRKAASEASRMGAMLAPEQAETVAAAVDAARKAARTITKRAEEVAENGAIVLMDIQRGALEKARIAFLDLDDSPAPAGEAMPAFNVQRFAEMDDASEPPPGDSRSGAILETARANDLDDGVLTAGEV